MTPERAQTIALHWLREAHIAQARYYEMSLAHLILAACSEERHAALTEAAEWATTRHIGCEATANEIREDILALRDKEQP